MMPRFTVFGKPNCPYCTQAKNLLESKDLKVSYVDIVADPPKREVMFALVKQATGSAPRTVPQIFYGSEYIGGFEELKKYLAA